MLRNIQPVSFKTHQPILTGDKKKPTQAQFTPLLNECFSMVELDIPPAGCTTVDVSQILIPTGATVPFF